MKINPDRVNLAEAIPLSTPLSVVMESTSRCNFACTFCPTSHLDDVKRVGLRKQDMPYSMFYKILCDLKQFPDKLYQLHFHYDGEPLLQKHLPEWIRYASHWDVANDYMIRTNGSLLTHDLTDELVRSGITRIGISVEAVSEEGYARLTGKKGAYKQIYDNMVYLYQNKGKIAVYVKIIDFGTADTDPDKFMQTFSPIVDIATVEYPMQWNNGVSDTTMGRGLRLSVNGDYNVDHIACPYPFYTMGISSRGQVNACCFDWSWQTTFGDVIKESLKDIWNGERRRQFLLMHLSGNRKDNPACRDCTAHYACPDNIDDRRLEIAARL